MFRRFLLLCRSLNFERRDFVFIDACADVIDDLIQGDSGKRERGGAHDDYSKYI